MNDAVDEGTLVEKVTRWLTTEGYPTEFKAAALFEKHGFAARQGIHVKTKSSDTPREIDVLASKSIYAGENILVRSQFVAECKWSKDKPWVILTSPAARHHPAASIAQTISSELGSAALWALAGEEACQASPLFSAPTSPGFNGRQAFSKGVDLFYSAAAGVTSAASGLAASYDDSRPRGRLPSAAVCQFCVIVVDGELMTASYEAESGDLTVSPADSVRCLWRGAPEWPWHTPIDIVRLNALDTWLEERSDATDRLLGRLAAKVDEISACFSRGSLEPLTALPAPRGMVGIHPLLAEVTGGSQSAQHERS